MNPFSMKMQCTASATMADRWRGASTGMCPGPVNAFEIANFKFASFIFVKCSKRDDSEIALHKCAVVKTSSLRSSISHLIKLNLGLVSTNLDIPLVTSLNGWTNSNGLICLFCTSCTSLSTALGKQKT